MRSSLVSPLSASFTASWVLGLTIILVSICMQRDASRSVVILTPPTPPWLPDRAIQSGGPDDHLVVIDGDLQETPPWEGTPSIDSNVQQASFETLILADDACGEAEIQEVCGWEEPFANEPDPNDRTHAPKNRTEDSEAPNPNKRLNKTLSDRVARDRTAPRVLKDTWSEEGLFGTPSDEEAESNPDGENVEGITTDNDVFSVDEEMGDAPELEDRTDDPMEDEADLEESQATVEKERKDISAVDHEFMGPAWYAPSIAFSPEMEARQARIRQVLDHYYRLPFNAQDDSPWSMMHHILAWAADARNYVGAPGTELVSTIGWICGNAPCERERLLVLANQRITPRNGPGLQGHEGQLLAMFAQARLSRLQPIRVQGQDFTIEDLISSEQATCRNSMELTFKLIGFSHYLAPEATWKDAQGSRWDFARLIDEEIRAPIIGAACGGTHRLMGLACAVRLARRHDLEIAEHWERAQKHVSAYQISAFHLQNADGSFSSDWFRRRATWGGLERKLKTTGHFTEWLAYSLPNDQLRRPEMARAIDFLCNALVENRFAAWPKGPLSHAIRALSLYDERVFGNPPGQRRSHRPELASPLPPRSSSTPPSAISGNQGRQPSRTSNAPTRPGIPVRRGR
jgi:hypothetical protein